MWITIARVRACETLRVTETESFQISSALAGTRTFAHIYILLSIAFSAWEVKKSAEIPEYKIYGDGFINSPHCHPIGNSVKVLQRYDLRNFRRSYLCNYAHFSLCAVRYRVTIIIKAKPHKFIMNTGSIGVLLFF
jgi:hypothetical protein